MLEQDGEAGLSHQHGAWLQDQGYCHFTELGEEPAVAGMEMDSEENALASVRAETGAWLAAKLAKHLRSERPLDDNEAASTSAKDIHKDHAFLVQPGRKRGGRRSRAGNGKK